MTNYHHG